MGTLPETTLAEGQTLAIDGWSWPSILEDADGYEGAAFRVYLPNARVSLPVRIEIGGRKVRWEAPIKGGGVRVRIVFLDDGPAGRETVARGWMSFSEIVDGTVRLNPGGLRIAYA